MTAIHLNVRLGVKVCTTDMCQPPVIALLRGLLGVVTLIVDHFGQSESQTLVASPSFELLQSLQMKQPTTVQSIIL